MEKRSTPVDSVYKKVHPITWPLRERGEPELTEGSVKLDKPFIMRMKENVWNSVDEHCKRLGISKSRWILEAALNQLDHEQQYFAQKGQEIE